MIARRIQRYFNLDFSIFPKDYWYYVFPETVGKYNSFNYFPVPTRD